MTDKIAVWTKVLDFLEATGQGKFFAFGDSCVAAIHYQGPYEGMEGFDFAALREDYDAVVPAMAEAAGEWGLALQYQVIVGGVSFQRPFARLGAEGVWCNLYPLDAIPAQVTLRFMIFKEAKGVMASFKSMEESGDYLKMPQLSESIWELQRYNGLHTGVVARLMGYAGGGHMGERTIFTRTIEVEDVFPLRTMTFSGHPIVVAKKVSNWTAEMTPERIEVIQTIQREGIESLSEIDRVCRQLGIDYFMCGGSMLGALRHQGFIPWDDDMDVGMTRKNYVRFIKEAPALLDERYSIQLPSTDRHSHFVYARLRKSGTEYITSYNEDKDFHKGLWIDIFPFDVRPKNEGLAKVQNKCANILARASMGFKRRKEYVEHDVTLATPIACEKDRSYLKSYHTKSKFFPVALCRGGYHFAARVLNPFGMGKANALYASYIPSYTTISAQELLPTRYVPYETGEFPIPAGAEAFLTRQYGDYMALPAVHERYAEHGFKCLRLADGRVLRG